MARISVLAPLDGEAVALENLPDEAFAQKIAGDGVAINPSGSTAVAPVTGNIITFLPGEYAFQIATDAGVELIVQIGLDTVKLKGKGFESIVSEDQDVQAGTPVLRFDRSTLERHRKVVLSPTVSIRVGTIVWRASGTVRAGRDVLFVLEV